MKYTGVACEACGKVFTETDDAVVCPVCGSPHHRDCWQRAGRCAHDAQHAEGFAWVSPIRPEPPLAEKRERAEDGAVVCPNCGEKTFENELYCLRCGTRLHPEPGDRYVPGEDSRADDARRREVIDAFNRFGGLDPNSLVDGIPVCEYADFVGGKAPGRLIRKAYAAERFGRSISWILPAFLFGPIWFFYRKMKKEGLLISLAVIALATAVGLLQINGAFVSYVRGTADAVFAFAEGELTRSALQDTLENLAADYQSAVLTGGDRVKMNVASVLQYLLIVGCPVGSSLLALGRYRKKVRESVFEIRRRCSDIHTYRDTLVREGGVSPGLAVVGAALMLIALLCMNYLPTMIALMQ